MPTTTPLLRRCLPLIVLGLLLVAADPWITFVYDEVNMIDGAARPAGQIIGPYLSGRGQHEHPPPYDLQLGKTQGWQLGPGQHEHPPLYDLFLHGWLEITGGAMRLLRLPTMAFFLLGVAALGEAAYLLGGEHARDAALWLSALWPYGFHYGRLAAWYSLAFLLVSVTTWFYLRALQEPKISRWLALCLAALALVYTNYFGWALLACLGLDLVVWHRAIFLRHARAFAGGALLLLGAYAPLWRVFLRQLGASTGVRDSPLAVVFGGGFTLQALFSSESVAPWFWWLSAPVVLGVVACLAIIVFRTRLEARRFWFYFLGLYAAMLLLGIEKAAKRLMLIAPWMLLPLAVALAALSRERAGRVLAISLGVIFAIGWVGIASRRFYAAPRFIEPWPEVAGKAARLAQEGAMIVGDHPVFLFYLTYALEGPPGRPFAGVLGISPRDPRVYDTQRFLSARSIPSTAVLVKGAGFASIAETTRRAEQWLSQNCRPQSVERLLRDPGFELKQRYFPQLGQQPWRAEISVYSCPGPTGSWSR